MSFMESLTVPETVQLMVDVAGLCASAPAFEVMRPAGIAPFFRAQAKSFICLARTDLSSTSARALATRSYVSLILWSTGSPVLDLSWYLLAQISNEASCIGIVVITACALAFIAALGISGMFSFCKAVTWTASRPFDSINNPSCFLKHCQPLDVVVSF